jgi:hypothetical protein
MVVPFHGLIDLGRFTTGKNLSKAALYQRVIWFKHIRLLNSRVRFFDAVRVDKSQRGSDIGAAGTSRCMPRWSAWSAWSETVLRCLGIGQARLALL